MSDRSSGSYTSDVLRRPLSTLEAAWLGCISRMATAGRQAALPLYGTAAGRVALGKGAGGDHTLAIDRACEVAMQRVLQDEAPVPYKLVSEESGIGGEAAARWVVVMDPLDGSLNAKRGLEPFCASVGVAQGGTMGDVAIGYIEDYTRGRSFAAVRGVGLLQPGDGPDGWAACGAARIERERFESHQVELVLLEAGRPDAHHFRFDALGIMAGGGRSADMRVRQIGSLALSLCYVAVGVADILVAAVPARSVDLAAGLLILSEAGGGAAAFGGGDVWAQPLDLEKRCAVVAWRAGLNDAELIARSRELERAVLEVP